MPDVLLRVLHYGDTLYRDGTVAAGTYFPKGVFAYVPEAVRESVRYFYTGGEYCRYRGLVDSRDRLHTSAGIRAGTHPEMEKASCSRAILI